MKGFRQKFQSNWDMVEWSDQCVGSTPLDCPKGDGFVKFTSVKLPARLKISVSTDISVLGFYRYIKDISVDIFT